MKRGFTLIELLVVVLIIGILAAVALPQYQRSVNRARAAEARMAIKAIQDALQSYYLANGSYPENLENLDISIGATGTVLVGTDQYSGFSLSNWNVYSQQAGSGTSLNSFSLQGKTLDAKITIGPNETGPYSCYGTDCKDVASSRVGTYHAQTSSTPAHTSYTYYF